MGCWIEPNDRFCLYDQETSPPGGPFTPAPPAAPHVWDRIARVEARDYSPFRDYGGWGIRIGPRGWAYNVSGSQGIELTFTAGHRILIGTRDPEGFMRAVEQARNEYRQRGA